MTVGKRVVELGAARRARAGGHDVVRGHLSALDPRWDCRTVIELSSASFDPDVLGLGSSPWLGDVGSTGLVVPTVATPDQTRRYLFRLLAVEIPSGKAIVIRGIRQLATIRAFPGAVPLELEITSPFWRFVDGNISWHLRWEGNAMAAESVFDALQAPGVSPTTSGQDTALLYVPQPGPLPYVPPGSGIPPGLGVDFLGTWRDMRYPWDAQWPTHIPVIGPGIVKFYASVHQTSAARPPLNLPAGFEIEVLRPEDAFVAAFEAEGIPTQYGRVAGSLMVDLLPCCEVPP